MSLAVSSKTYFVISAGRIPEIDRPKQLAQSALGVCVRSLRFATWLRAG